MAVINVGLKGNAIVLQHWRHGMKNTKLVNIFKIGKETWVYIYVLSL